MREIAEEWKIINKFPDYKISNHGRVFSIKKNIFLKPRNQGRGYFMVALYHHLCKKPKNIYIHRLVIEHFLYPSKSEIDHINRIKTDNVISNLRYTTRSKNCINITKTKKPKTSKYKGVSFDKKTNKWSSNISCNCQAYRLGKFTNELDAAIAYNNKALELFGKGAVLNELKPVKFEVAE